ncbi:ADIPOR-like receptor Izh3p [[Candida] jaroonii]|uniref:ADIPOR-like receptor Izh3p n=1 Tax=[Candida] jaroonii TaxID=467808 RepID=A0ACA9YF89_9ASCO|nr:ADIPOR-like receptor Izh3p [[Candida] jaroonii]
MSEVSTLLRNRTKPKDASTEELLIEKLDLFLSSIESRLDRFEQYFKFTNLQDLDDDLKDLNESAIDDDDTADSFTPRSRSNSNASLQSFKNFAKLDLIHQRLKLIKSSVLKSSISNLDYLYKTLDDQYNYLFSNESFSPSDLSNYSKEILSEKIITTLHYFDEKLMHIDDVIQKKMKKPVDTDGSIFNIFKFYNFNKALKLSQKRYLNYYELPLGWRENRYIINGYRFSLSHKTMLKSIFQFNHNESMNIWSHLLGVGLMVYLGMVHYPTTKAFELNSFQDDLVVYFFLACAITCLISSSVWHTYSCFAKLATRYNFACIDYTGITILITSSIIAVEYVSLYNYPKLLVSFVAFSIFCGVSGLAFNWSPYFDKPECRSIRIGYFVSLAGLGVGTMIVTVFFEGFIKGVTFFAPLFYKSFLWYWIGVIFYGGLIPERWRYDVIIDDDETCDHDHTSSDVLSGNIEKSGEEEYEEIETELTQILSNEQPENEDQKFDNIIQKHFPLKPKYSNYRNDFFSLWWIDYAFSSHNLWHMCVLSGVVGHYYCVLEMFTKIH